MWTTPWVMKYARISFLSVSFRQQGKMHTVHLTPVQPGAVTAGQINDCVGRWFERVRQAAGQCTGTMPHASDPASVSVSPEPAWNRKALPLRRARRTIETPQCWPVQSTQNIAGRAPYKPP